MGLDIAIAGFSYRGGIGGWDRPRWLVTQVI